MSSSVAVLIPAGGASRRFGGKTKKQFAEIAGRAVFLRTIEPFADHPDVKQSIMAIPPEDEELFQIKWSAKLDFYGVKVVHGGAERYETVRNMLAAVKSEMQMIALHDAVRPCVTREQIDAVFAAAEKHGAALLAHRIVGTVKKVDPDLNVLGTVDRSGLWEAQTPQVFKRDILFNAYEQIGKIQDPITDDAQLVEATGGKVKIVESDPSNIKITSKTDLAVAKAILGAREEKKPKGYQGPWGAEQGW